MQIRKMTFIFIALFAVFAGTIHLAHATIGDNDITFEVNPEIPGPRQQVTITATSYAIDLNKAQIAWKENNVMKKRRWCKILHIYHEHCRHYCNH